MACTSTSVIAEQVKFPILGEDDVINTKMLMDAATGITHIIVNFGKQFSMCSDDMKKNVEKIRKKYEVDQEKFSDFKKLLEFEKANAKPTADDSATTAGLWLKRGLEFVCEFFWELVAVSGKCQKPYKRKDSSAKENLSKAYEMTLKQYHNIATKMVFKGAALMCPYKEALLASLLSSGKGQEQIDDDTMDQVIADMKECEAGLRQYCHRLGQLYTEFGYKDRIVDLSRS